MTITTGSAASSTPIASATPTATPTANSNNMYKVGFEWPRETELGKELFLDNMKVINGKLTFTLPINANGSKWAADGSSVDLTPGKSYSFTLGKGAGFLSISKPESKGDQWEGYYIRLDTSGNKDLKELFGKITDDAVVLNENGAGSPLSEVKEMAKKLK
ncbi:hypothetical protein D3C75_347440 [compost metagenome]